MLLPTDEKMYNTMVADIKDDKHPAHVGGTGPEQDYLSRHFADRWTHIGAEYNFQLHQLFFALSPTAITNSRRIDIASRSLNDIREIHYSGDRGLKPWDFVLENWSENQMGAFVDKVSFRKLERELVRGGVCG
jgi:lipopolysaccharide biosynthesis glycosyltransferase